MPVAIFVVCCIMKSIFGGVMQPVAVVARLIGAMEQASLAKCILYQYLHANEQHFAFCPKCRCTVSNMAYISMGMCWR
jgi:hypothetical protein